VAIVCFIRAHFGAIGSIGQKVARVARVVFGRVRRWTKWTRDRATKPKWRIVRRVAEAGGNVIIIITVHRRRRAIVRLWGRICVVLYDVFVGHGSDTRLTGFGTGWTVFFWIKLHRKLYGNPDFYVDTNFLYFGVSHFEEKLVWRNWNCCFL